MLSTFFALFHDSRHPDTQKGGRIEHPNSPWGVFVDCFPPAVRPPDKSESPYHAQHRFRTAAVVVTCNINSPLL